MDLKERIKKTIIDHRLIEEGDILVLGLSGGPDSLSLFDVLLRLSNEMGFKMHAVHVNHRLRGANADEDQRFVEDICAAEDVPCHSIAFDCEATAKKLGLGLEETGRMVRYSEFRAVAEELAEECGDKSRVKLVLAHNMNDQAETILFRIMRGTGTDGLAGIEYEREEAGYKIIRPLLDCKRGEIEAYCEEMKLNPRIDQTNDEALYSRNKIRLELIPYIEKNFNDNIVESLVRLSEVSKQDSDVLWSSVYDEYEEPLDPKRLKALPLALRHRLIIYSFEKKGLMQDITMSHLTACDKIIESSKPNSAVDFPHGYSFKIAYDRAYVSAPGDGLVTLPPMSEQEEARGAIWRHRKTGDYMKVKISKAGEPEAYGRKKIQDIFIDKKVPRDDRDKIYLLCVGNEVIRIAYDFKDKRII